nr:class I SAM-dependent methyltransferase [Kineosphaera limosa]
MGEDAGVTTADHAPHEHSQGDLRPGHDSHADQGPDGLDRFSDLAATWDERPGTLERATSVAAAVRAAVPLSSSTCVLEIGGGTGLLSRMLADEIGTAVITDVAPGMVSTATRVLDDPRYAGWRAEMFDVERDALPTQRYDLVLSMLALHHMGDIATVLGRIFELVAPGGHAALADLEHDADGGFHRHVHNFHGHHGFTREALVSGLERAGFVDVTVDVAGHDTKEVDGEPRRFPILLAVGRRP